MFTTISKVWQMLKPFHTGFKIFLGLMIFYEAFQIAETYTLGAVLNFYDQKVSWQTWAIFLGFLLFYDELFIRFGNLIDERVFKIHIDQTYQYLKNVALKKFFELTLGWHQDRNSAALVQQVNRGVDKVHELIQTVSWDFVPGLIQLVLTMIPLVLISPFVAVVLLIALGLFIYVTVSGHNQLEPLRKYRFDLYDEESKAFVQDVRAISTVRFSGQEEKFITDFEDIHKNIIDTAGKELKILIVKIFANRMRVLTISKRLILGILVWQLIGGYISIAILVYANTLSEKLIANFWRFARIFDQASKATEPAQRLSDLLAEKPDMIDEGNITQSEKPLDIVFENVGFGYNETQTIQNLSFKIPNGKFIALVGPSGAGKSTIFSLLMRDYDINSGNIFVGGENLKNWKISAYRDLVAVVPQQVDIFDTTIMDNLILGNTNITESEVIEACKKAYIHNRIMEFKDGYKTKVGEDGQRLSGGERQRLAIARALLKSSAQIYLFDEPTSALDSESENYVEEAMQSIGKTRIVIAHRLATVKHADLIIVVDKGTVAESGTHAELLAKNGIYKNLASRQNLE